MLPYIAAYLAAAIAMAGLDYVWLTTMMGPLYQRVLGPILAPEPNMIAAVAFYLVYLVGIVWFAVRPALESGDWKSAALNGALFGLFAYATYDLTNMATLKVWSLQLTLIDMAWGAALTVTAASAGALAALHFAPR
ncbi:MAG: DUF2177 family protein [Proteobacteria bacterium]|nr:MAG: DUF2177 family protein [Pseudomonadota bacterium]